MLLLLLLFLTKGSRTVDLVEAIEKVIVDRYHFKHLLFFHHRVSIGFNLIHPLSPTSEGASIECGWIGAMSSEVYKTDRIATFRTGATRRGGAVRVRGVGIRCQIDR